MHFAVFLKNYYHVSFYPGLRVLHRLPTVILFQENCGEQNFLHIYSIHTEIFLFPERFVSTDIKSKDHLVFQTGKKILNQNWKPTKRSKCLRNFGNNVLAQLLYIDLLKVYYFMAFLFKYFGKISFQSRYYGLVAI